MQWLNFLGEERHQKWVEWNKPTYPHFVSMYNCWVFFGKPDLPVVRNCTKLYGVVPLSPCLTFLPH
jgi:hypothetical protein